MPRGKPEKLVKVADGRSPQSGLPATNSADELGWEAGPAPDQMVPPETPENPDSPPRAQPGTLPQSKSHPLYERLAQPATLLVGAGVVLLSILRLLFGGSAAPNPPGQDEAGIPPIQIPAREPATGGADPARGFAATESEPVLNAAHPASGVDAGRADLTTPASEDRTVPTTEPSSASFPTAAADEDGAASAEPAVSRLDASGAPVVTASSVVDARVCGGLVTRDPDGAPLAEWRCHPIVDRAATGQLFFYTRIRSPTSTTVEHRWIRDGVLEQEVDLRIGANDGPGYRTYSVRSVSAQGRGAWRVELRSEDRELLYAEELVVR